MRISKRFTLAASAAVIALFATSAMAEGEKIVIGTEGAYPPFNNLEADGTLTDALGRRDALRLRHHVLTTAADAAAGAGQYGYSRQLRSELKMLSALSVGDLRSQADQVAQELRALDVRIQKANWEIELLD